jgi:membrane protease YdiL (CAAX protease family)
MARSVRILIGLFLALVVPILATQHFIPEGTDYTVAGAPIGREVFWWALGIVVVLYVLVIEREQISSIGFGKVTWRTLAFGILGGVVSFVGIGVIFVVVFPLLHLHANNAALTKMFATPYWYRVVLVTRAAVVEEILFRGYAIERLSELTGSRALAALIALAAFTYAHLGYWGWAQLLVAGFGGIVLTVLYLWRRDLPPT